MKRYRIFHFIFLIVMFSIGTGSAYAQNDNSTPPDHETQVLRRLDSSRDEPPLPPSLRDYEVKEAPKGDRFYSELMNMLFTLGVIVLILVGLSWILKRMMSTRLQQVNESSNIKIVEQRSITPRTSVFILDVMGQRIAIAESSNGVIRLGEVPEEHPPMKKFEIPENRIK